MRIARTLVFSLLSFYTFQTHSEAVRQGHVEAQLISEKTRFAPSEKFRIGVFLRLDPKWHVYWLNPGDSGEPVKIDWPEKGGFQVEPLRWPSPKRILLPPLVNYGYENEVLFSFEAKAPSIPVLEPVSLKATVKWLVCEETCIPGKADLTLKLAPTNSAAAYSAWKTVFDGFAAATPELFPSNIHGDWSTSQIVLTFPRSKEIWEEAYFYPRENGLISHASPQRWEKKDGGYVLTVDKSVTFPKDTRKELEGLLEVRKNGKTQTYEIHASSEKSSGFWAALLFAFLGGVLLNLMPCVFPVLSIKVLSFANLGGESRRTALLQSAWYSVGILVSFWILASALLILRASGQELGWGFQLQSPRFLLSLIALLVLFALNLLGVFEFTGRFSSLGSSLAAKEGIVGSFFSGVLATLVATPCTAPFMGTAMGFALSQSPGVALLIFSSLGLGLAFPYVFLSLFPSLQRKLPRPGHWMERFKHAMAFPLFLTAAWLLWVLGLQVGVDALFEILLFLICLAFTFWAFGLSRTIRARFFWIFLASVLSAASLYRIQPLSAEPMSDQAQGAWMPFDDAAFEKALDSGKPVFVDFTAAWCITCKVNEKVALNISSVQKKFKEKEVQLFQADWTNQNSEIARRLENYGRSGVPLYVLYPEGRKSAYVLLPQILTPEIVLKALEKLP